MPRESSAKCAHFWKLSFIPFDSDLASNAEAIAQNFFLRGADALYIALARRMNAPLVTLDSEMLERVPVVITCLSPADWLKNNAST